MAITQPRENNKKRVPVVGDGAAHTSMASANLIARAMRRADQARSGALLRLSGRRGGTVRRRCIVMMGVQRVAECSVYEECLEAGELVSAGL